jgi:hypothetical protein
MLSRLFVTLTAALVLVALALPAAAVEEDGTGGSAVHGQELPTIDEVGTQSETARQFFPEPAEEQPFAEALIYPLMGIGLLAVLAFLVLYLRWQPAFGAEDRARRR